MSPDEFPDAAALFDGVDPRALADAVGTPTYVYSAAAIRGRIDALQRALRGVDARICYAVKANPNLAVLRLMAEAGIGADIVSAGELRRATAAGIPTARIVFSGVGKTADELAAALDAGVARYNVESRDELELLSRLARERGVVAHVAARINPDVDAGTHDKISTGRAGNKFGVAIDEAGSWFDAAARHPSLRIDGLHVHIGSQIVSVEPFRAAIARVAAFAHELRARGHAIASIDVGGGLGVRYRPGDVALPLDAYAAVLKEYLGGLDGHVIVEPGRYLVAEAGLLLTRVLRIKRGADRDFLVLDAAMNDLLRPSLYDAWHEIVPLRAPQRPRQRYDVVGPVCESSDTFAVARELPGCEAGDLVAIMTAGAYGASMASTYNSRPLAAEVLVDAGRHAVVRRRQSFDAMIAGETPAPEWHTA